jgi:hypothetical protein
MRHGKIRIECILCEDQRDGLQRLPRNWTDVERVRSHEHSTETHEDILAARGETMMDWQTHMGLCPKCTATST